VAEVIFHSMADSAYLWTVVHVADEKGVAHDFAALEYGSAQHLQLHPFGKMPVMQHGAVFLYESLAIAHYIDRTFGGPALQPSTALAQAQVLRWVSIVNAYIFPTMNRFMKERLVRPAWGFEPDQEFIASARAPLLLQMRLINEAMSGGAFLTGNELTIADSFLLPHLLFFGRTPEGGALLAKAPAAASWLRRMMERPSFPSSAMSAAYKAFEKLPPPAGVAWTID
jgi:glutathione S-transferase